MGLRRLQTCHICGPLRVTRRRALQPLPSAQPSRPSARTHQAARGVVIARYREKDETDLVWNRIRRQITRDLDTEIMNRREEALNNLLSSAWHDYTKAIGSGELREVEAKYSSLVAEIVRDIVRPKELVREVADS